MKKYYRFDENGYYLTDVIADYTEDNPMPGDVTDIRPPDGLYRGRFDGEKWAEDAPKPEVEEGMRAVWDGETKTWSIEPETEPPIDPVRFILTLTEALTGTPLTSEQI